MNHYESISACISQWRVCKSYLIHPNLKTAIGIPGIPRHFSCDRSASGRLPGQEGEFIDKPASFCASSKI